MANAVIDWFFGGAVSNADGSHPAIIAGGANVPGPGDTPLGARPTARVFGPGIKCSATLLPAEIDASRFAIRITFRVTSNVTTRCNLVESTALPFSMFVQAGTAPDRFNLEVSVGNGVVGWVGASSFNRTPLMVGQWYTATLVYDIDTAALFIGDRVFAVSAFPNGSLQAATGDKIHVGTWVDGARWPLAGEIAGLQVWKDIPEALEAKLDAERGNPEWHLTRKANELRPSLNLGPLTGDYYFDSETGSYILSYSSALLSYSEAHGAAFVMYGAILAMWRNNRSMNGALGALVSDEQDGRVAGTRRSVFVNGAIYWSPETGAQPVLGRFFLDFDMLSEGASSIGLPIAPVENIGGGQVQRFRYGKMYLRNGASNAFEVHGAILAKYEAAGGPAAFGFPITHEGDVKRDTASIGKLSEFERCSIYWSPSTPACIVYGAIRDNYRGAPDVQGAKGPLGDLGFPITDELDVPGVPRARYNAFQRGSIVWFEGPTFICRPFNVFLGVLDTKEEDRDLLDLDGPNDLYCRVCIDVNGGRVFDRKYPEGRSSYASANVIDLGLKVPYEITPNAANLEVGVRVEVWESDGGNVFGGGDDRLGTMTKTLNIQNAWGQRESNGVFTSSGFGPWVNSLAWSARPVSTDLTPFDFWTAKNKSTEQLSRGEYAAAFADVDPDFEVRAPHRMIEDGLKELYYDLVVKGVARGGNCVGMSAEAIYAWKDLSRLGRPLSRFGNANWQEIENDFNVKHAYQVGADAIWWFVTQFLSGNTHDPVDVFNSTWRAFNRGENPAVCIAQNYDFSGAPHCILPFAWDNTTTPWRMEVFDSNIPGQTRTVLVDKPNNRFTYEGADRYSGDAWSGGRLYYLPWPVLNHRQRTPLWDAIMLLMNGVICIFGDSTEVSSLSDEKGNRLDAGAVKSRDSLTGKLLEIPGMGGAGTLRGSMFAGIAPRKIYGFNSDLIGALKRVNRGPLLVAQTVNNVAREGTLRQRIDINTPVQVPVPHDLPVGSIYGPAIFDLVKEHGIEFLRPAGPTDLDCIHSTLRGNANGKMTSYFKRALIGVNVAGDIAANEKVTLAFDRMTNRENQVTIQADRSRVYSVGLTHKLGAGDDFIKTSLSGLPSEIGVPVAFNMQPGGRVLNVLSGGAPANVQVKVEGLVGGKKILSTFNTQLQGGQRLILPDLADPSRLKVSNTDSLLGSGRNFKLVQKQ